MDPKRASYIVGSVVILEAARRVYLRYRHRQLALMPWGINQGYLVSRREAIRAADPRFGDRFRHFE
jgi:hypothetical protein